MSVNATISFNVEASMNQWLRDTLLLITLPSWMPTVSVVFAVPETSAAMPCISAHHRGVSQALRWQGGEVGGARGRRAAALMDVSVWASRSSTNWLAQQAYMMGMVETTVTGTASVPIYDFVSVPSVPVLTDYKIDLGSMDVVDTAPDPNPDVERRRILVRYDWTVRSTING